MMNKIENFPCPPLPAAPAIARGARYCPRRPLLPAAPSSEGAGERKRD